MLKTIDRYVIREVIPPFFLSLLIFTFLLEIPPVMRELETLVAKGVSWEVAGRIVLTLIPQGLGLTIPMALLTGLLIGLGRVSADREAVALLACGVSPYRLLRPVLLMAMVAAGATMYVMIKAIPDANQTFREITFEVVTKKVENDIRPREFFEDFPGWVLYVRDQPEHQSGWNDVLVANTSKPDATEIFLSSRGRLVLKRDERLVDLVLEDGTRYTGGKPGETQTYRFGQLTMSLNPDSVFRRAELPRGVTEKTIAELRQDIATKIKGGISPHPEIMQIEQKFSIPVACFVFAVIGLALGLTVARDSKLAGFVVGVAVIFAYYIVMFLAEAYVKGYYAVAQPPGSHYPVAHLARWIPNILLGLFGVAALIWRARFSERQLPISLPFGVPHLPARWSRGTAAPSQAAPAARRPKVVVVLRLPAVKLPLLPGLLDRYVSRLYLRVIGLSFLALLGLFYISTFIDASDKLFKGVATSSMVMQLLVYKTPQFIYFVIPIAALLSVLVTFGTLSRTSELTVIKACGVSLYRVAVPVVVLSLCWSAALFALDQEILARANRRAGAIDDTIRGRPPKTFSPLNRRWVIGRDGSIYHYGFFDPRSKTLSSLTAYRLAGNKWRLASETFASTAQYRDGWIGLNGWTQDFPESGPKRWRRFAQQPLTLEPPDYFATEIADSEMMTAAQLRRSIAELSQSGFNYMPQAVELQRKVAFPFVTFVMTLLAVPFGVTTGRRGALYGIGLGIVIALSYWLVMSVFIAIGKTGLLPPALAAWTPNILVSACAVYLVLTTKT
jgi:LPS export ABC transporter permease LptG/LPS export ABC transporter permease LptF